MQGATSGPSMPFREGFKCSDNEPKDARCSSGDLSSRGGSARAPPTARGNHPRYNLRNDPKKSERYESGSRKAKRAAGTEEAPKDSSGWATLDGGARVPYLLDSGADASLISEEMLVTLLGVNTSTLSCWTHQ